MQNSNFDIAIVGGGLAGLSLSIQCADAGYKVALFEKEKYPFHKVCGEYISFESYPFLEKLGLDFSQWNIPFIKQLQVSDTQGKLYKFSLDLGGFGISRFALDNALYEIALQKNVHIFTETKVQDIFYENDQFNIVLSNNIFTAKSAAASFGKRSNIDIKWKRNFTKEKENKLNNYVGIKYHVQYPHEEDLISLHNFHNGYCGISNIENDASCLCYLTSATNLQNNDNSIIEMEKNVLFKNPQLEKIFTGATFLYDKPLAISQISFSKKNQVEDHVLMVGDAAGMITPLCGNGMSMAMHASKIAFENIDNFLQGNISRSQMEENYTNRWRKQFSKRLFIGRNVQRTFGGNTSTATFLRLMNGFPSIANKLIRSTHGEKF
jgi:flavin-dependent dehydrogenase